MGSPTPEFVTQVKDALDHLYDPVHLRGHPLVSALVAEAPPDGTSVTQTLRKILLDAIERVNVRSTASTPCPSLRTYQILQMRYVEALPFREVMAELGLSQTQYHREQRHAIDVLATFLWERATLRHRRANPSTSPADPSGPTDTLAAGLAGASSSELNAVVRGVSDLLRPWAEAKGVTFAEELYPQHMIVPGNRTTVRQVVISLTGYILDVVVGGHLTLSNRDLAGNVALRLAYHGTVPEEKLAAAPVCEHLLIAQRLVAELGGNLGIDCQPEGITIEVRLRGQHCLLLVIDDNLDMVQLIARSVADRQYTVRSAASVREGVALARDVVPDVIILDIMMTDQDGWDALQCLKHDPTTQGIPIVVCTVLAEAQLAHALGASAFLRKPLTRQALLATLARLESLAIPVADCPAPFAPDGAIR